MLTRERDLYSKTTDNERHCNGSQCKDARKEELQRLEP